MVTGSRVVLMCGPAGSGKSTYATSLAANGWVRLSIDEEAWRMGHREMPLPRVIADRIRADQRERLVQLVEAGRDVVVDYSFWRRADRDEYRELVRAHGGTTEVVYVRVSNDEVRRRMRRRNHARLDADSFRIDAGLLDSYLDAFEHPEPDETDVRTIHG